MTTQSDFATTYGPLADDISKETGLDRSVVLGHIAQETGFGQHVQGNNIFGISPGGKVANYPDVSTAAKAYVDLMKGDHYKQVVAPGTADEQALRIGQSGYGPKGDASYGSKVLSLSQQFRPAAKSQTLSTDDVLGPLQTPLPSSGLSADDVLGPVTPKAATEQTGGSVGTKTFKPEPTSAPSDELDMGQAPVAQSTADPAGQSTISSQRQSTSLSDFLRKEVEGDTGFANDMVAAGKDGWKNAPTLLGAPSQTFIDRTVPALGMAAHGVNALMGGAGALYRVSQEGINQLGNAVSPGLGRDLAAGMDIIPGLQAERAFGVVGANRPTLSATQESNMLGSRFKNDPFTPEMAAKGNKSSLGQGPQEDSVWNNIKLDKTNTPNADPTSPQTAKFADSIKDMIFGSMVGSHVGTLAYGPTGAVWGSIAGPLIQKFGPEVGGAVVKSLMNSVKTSATGTLQMVGTSEQNKDNKLGAVQPH